MSFEVDRLSSAWAHIARCADPTWNHERRDAFTVANQRLLAQHCKISQVFRDLSKSSLHSQQEKTENGTARLRSVKDVIPESRLAQFYGDFYYDDARENCYLTVTSNRSNERCNVTRYESSEQTECWMLPEVEYWFRKLTYDTGDRNVSRRRRHCKTLVEEEFERWVSSGDRAREETALEARIRGVRVLWQNNPQPTNFTGGNTPEFSQAQSPPASRKMRARRRQPRRLAISVQQNAALPTQLLCSSPTKFQLDVSHQPPLNFRRALGRIANNHQTAGRGATIRRSIYRNAQASKCTGLATNQKPTRAGEKKHGIWWPRNAEATNNVNMEEVKINQNKTSDINNNEKDANIENQTKEIENTKNDVPEKKEENNENTSGAGCTENERKKRLYSTVLSMTPPSPVATATAGSRPQKFTPGLIKLNPKIVFLTRTRPATSSKFEELEKQALEQYKPSDESIDTKFRELERQAEEQYSPSNSITSCGSHSSNTLLPRDDSSEQNKRSQKANKAKPLDSVVIYSQNFPDLSSRGRTKSIANLKNFHTPPRGEKKEQTHRKHRTMKSIKLKAHRAASDTEYYDQNIQGVHKNPVKWKVQAKKRHLSFSVSEPSSDEETASKPIKDARHTKKKNYNKTKVFDQGAGDLQKSTLH